MSERPGLLVALGGNAIARRGDDGTIAAQYRRAREALSMVATLVCEGTPIVLSHGNGPVVGNIVLRGELAANEVPPTPLFIAGADSEGGVGLVLQQVLGNLLRERGCARPVASVVTQVVVDAGDRAFAEPTKPIGPYYSAGTARDLATRRGWTIAEEPGRGWRRTVPSPRPIRIVETDAVRALLEAGVIPIAAGGGGVPVTEAPGGELAGVDAVVDKDWSAAVLAAELGIPTLAILMEADGIYRDWGTPDARLIERLGLADARAMLASPGLAAGSVRPKLAAATHFVERTGGTAIICASGQLCEAMEGRAGTRLE